MHAPSGLKDYTAALPFLGRSTLSHRDVNAGEWVELVLTYEVGTAGFADGGWLKVAFRFYSDWGLFQTTNRQAANYVSAEFVPRKPFPSESASTVRSLKVRFDQKGHERPFQKAVLIDIVDGYLKPGDRIIVRIGDRRFGGPGTRSQTFAEEAFQFRVFVDVVGASRFAQVGEPLVLAIHPGPPRVRRLITPRVARPGVPVPVTLRDEDVWGNLAPDFPTPPVLQIDHEGQTSSLPLAAGPSGGAWGRIVFTPPKPGLYRLHSGNAEAWLDVDNDIPASRPHFADLHIHSEDTVGVNTTETVLTQARDAAGLDVAGYTANDFNIRADRWEKAVAVCRQLHQESHFLCFPGTEWCGASAVGGDRNVIFLGEEIRFPLSRDGQPLRVFEWNEDTSSRKTLVPELPTASDLHDAYRDLAEGDRVLLVPHVGGRRALHEWHDPALERLVEVASSWGHFDWFYVDALKRGLQVGASAAGDEHRGRPGGGAPGVGSFGVQGGLTGFWVDELTSPSVARALRQRHTWATTGTRAVAHLFSGSHRQGDAFDHRGPLRLDYDLFAETGWEWIELRDDQGAVLEKRNLHQELGYSKRRVRVRWGGARIRDRYRWAEWRGTLVVEGTRVSSWRTFGLEHIEEKVQEVEPGTFTLSTDTYGDADTLELELDDLAAATLTLKFVIGAFDKTGDAQQVHPDPVTPGVERRITGEELLAAGAFTVALGGADLFVAFERVTDQPLPLRARGHWSVEPGPGRHPHRAFYLHARERTDAKIWTSPLFVRFEPSTP